MDGQVSTYYATVTREDGYWVAVVDGLSGGATEARTLANLEVEVRDLIAGLLDLDEDSLTVDMRLGDELSDIGLMVERMIEAQTELAKAREGYEAAQQDAVRALAQKGVSARDSAKLIGVSHQRISQLLNT